MINNRILTLHRPIFLWLICLLTLLSACTAPQSPSDSTTASDIDLVDCQLTSPEMSTRIDALCGTLTVFEDRVAAIGRQIDLNVAVIPAVSRNPAPDPIFFNAGGPGEAATKSFFSLYGAFNRINQKRDIVLLDQRGTGGSHPLDCPEDEEFETNASDEEVAELLSACLAELDADPRFYTTAIAMDDLDDVRAALGYDQINIYGVSYGTRAALTYLRQHPDHVRTLILDGVAPPNWSLGPTVAADAQHALELIFSRCAFSTDCQARFPNVPEQFIALLARLEDGPIDVTLTHPVTGELTTYQLTQSTFANTIHLISYLPETTALLPLLLETAHSQDDFGPIVAQTLSSYSALSESISTGMRLSVICSEDFPFFSMDSAVGDGYLGDLVTQGFETSCAVWPRGDIPSDFRDPVVSDVPVLLISGEADPVTPPANGELAARTLANSLHVVAPGMGHANIYRGCIIDLATKFIEDGVTQDLDINCIQEIDPMPFFTNFTGPVP